ASGSTKIRRAADAGLIVLFLGMIAAPVTRNLVSEPPVAAGTEKRALAPLPVLQLKQGGLKSFPPQFEAYYNDHFGYRTTLIHWLNVAKVRWLHLSSSPKVILGKKGWMFYTQFPIGVDYDAARPFTEAELDRWKHMLEARRDWLAERHIPYLFVIAPDKQSIYAEALPQAVRHRYGNGSRLDQLVAYLKEHSKVSILDLREPLRR